MGRRREVLFARRARVALGLVSSVVCLGAAASAEEPTPPTFGEAVDVRVVNIDVFVTDRKGRRVPGLTRDDFRVYQDGQPVQVTNFSRIVGGAPAPSGRDRVAELERDDDQPLAAVGEPVTTVLFVDNSTLTPPHRNRVLSDIEPFLVERVESGMRILIATYDRGLEVLTPVTTDAAAVRRILRRIAEMPARGLGAVSERRRAMKVIRETHELVAEAGPRRASEFVNDAAADGPRFQLRFDPCVEGWEQMIMAVDNYSQSAGARVGNVQNALVALTRSLGGLPGRKALLYLSDGLEQRPGIDFYSYLAELCPAQERQMFSYFTRWDETPRLEELAEYANAHRVTLYPLETAGLATSSAGSVEFDAGEFTPSARNDSLRISNLQSSLFILAEETGGLAFLNTNFPASELERMAEDSSDYYSLGIRPPGGWDGETHRIRVEMVDGAAKGRELRYPRRYRAIPEEERLAERTLATLVLGWEDNPLGTRVGIGEQQPADGDLWRVTVEIALPGTGLGALQRTSAEEQLIRILMIAEDERGERTTMRERFIPLRRAQLANQCSEPPPSVNVNIELAAGEHSIAVAVRDEIQQVTSFHRISLEVGASEASGS